MNLIDPLNWLPNLFPYIPATCVCVCEKCFFFIIFFI